MSSSDYRTNAKQVQQEINYRVIGRHMKDIRLACNMTQSSIAEKMALGQNTTLHLKQASTKLASFALFSFFA